MAIVGRRRPDNGQVGDRDVGRHPGALHAEERAVEQQHGAVEREPEREGRQAGGDNGRLVGREAAVLVQQPDDGRGQRRADRGRRDQQERDLAQARADDRALVAPADRDLRDEIRWLTEWADEFVAYRRSQR